MRILRARVPEFGPLRGIDLELEPGLNVLYGPNESGKTTLLDFLLAHLFRWERREGTRLSTVLGELDRFGDAGDTDGGVELRLDGEVLAYPGEGPSLLHHLELEHAGLAGLFCVRSGELELPEQEAGDFWRELKKVLAGLPEGVETLRRRAHEAGGLVPTGGRLADRAPDNLRSKRAELDRRIERLEGLAERLDEVAEAAEEISRLERRRERLERARVARIAELGGRRRETREGLDEIEAPSAEALRGWERARSGVERLEDELEARREALREAREEADRLEEEHREAERRAERLEERLERIREADLEERARRLADRRETGPAGWLVKTAFWIGGGLLVLAIGTVFFTPTDVLSDPTLLAVLLGALAAGALAHWWGRGVRRRRQEREAGKEALREDAAACGLDEAPPDELPEELPAAVRRLEREAREAGEALTAARERARAAAGRRDERAEEVEDLDEELEETRERLAELREAAGHDSLEEARRARERVDALEDRAERLEAALRELAGPDPGDWDADPPGDPEELPDWDSDAKQEVDRRLRELASERRELERAFDQAGLDAPEDVLPELQELRAEREKIDRDREAARLAAGVFSTMGEALDRRLADALEGEGPHSVGGLVRRVTGRYERVEREGDDDGLAVLDEEGRRWPLGRLSRGTRDQVYLALRLGLARSALEAAGLDEPGFFLLDDAFLTADWTRRERLVEAVADLADDGWQVVYLTCDDHLRRLFVEAGARLSEL